jgi:hypothetical protein
LSGFRGVESIRDHKRDNKIIRLSRASEFRLESFPRTQEKDLERLSSRPNALFKPGQSVL